MTVPDLALTEWVDWAGRSHRQLYQAAAAGNEPGRVYAAGREWETLGAELIAAAQELVERVRATAPGWQGVVAGLARWCADAGSTACDIGALVVEQGLAAEAAMIKMPEPVHFDWAGTLGGFAGGSDPLALVGDVYAASERAGVAHERAVDVMCELENRSREIDCRTPECPPWPPAVAVPPQVPRGASPASASAARPSEGPSGTGPEREDVFDPLCPAPAVIGGAGGRWQ